MSEIVAYVLCDVCMNERMEQDSSGLNPTTRSAIVG